MLTFKFNPYIGTKVIIKYFSVNLANFVFKFSFLFVTFRDILKFWYFLYILYVCMYIFKDFFN